MKYKYLKVMGLMSGTSIDGIDISIIKTNGSDVIRLNKNYYHPYEENIKLKLLNYIENYNKVIENTELYKEACEFVSIQHIKAIKLLCKFDDFDLIGFHGQTIFHNASKKLSIQLGNPIMLANFFQKRVIFNFRDNDINNNGQGAPLAPIFHKQIIEKNNLNLPTCIINIGGISNLTYWDGIDLIGFDTGPGNVLMDKYMQQSLKKKYDKNGKISSKGKSINDYINSVFLNDAYFKKNYPKSLDRNYFNKYLMDLLEKKLGHYDTMATLLDMTIDTIILGLKSLPKYPNKIFITGGGFNNKNLIKKLSIKSKLEIKDLNQFDPLFSTNFVEAELMAYLSARSIYNLPITYPKTTNVKIPLTGGKTYYPTKIL